MPSRAKKQSRRTDRNKPKSHKKRSLRNRASKTKKTSKRKHVSITGRDRSRRAKPSEARSADLEGNKKLYNLLRKKIKNVINS